MTSTPCNRPLTGLYRPVPALVNQALSVDGAQNGAYPPESPEITLELAVVNTAWPSLPDHIRAAILALVNTTKEAAI